MNMMAYICFMLTFILLFNRSTNRKMFMGLIRVQWICSPLPISPIEGFEFLKKHGSTSGVADPNASPTPSPAKWA